MQPAAEMPDDCRTDDGFKPTQLDKRTAFYTARKNGASITQAAKLAGVHRDTGTRWAAEEKVRSTQLEARSGAIATKTEIAAELTRIGLHDDSVAPRDKVNALLGTSKMLGYDAPTRTEQVIVNASVQQWIEAQRVLSPTPTAPTLPSTPSALHLPGAAQQEAIDRPGELPNQTQSSALSPSPNISQSEEK